MAAHIDSTVKLVQAPPCVRQTLVGLALVGALTGTALVGPAAAQSTVGFVLSHETFGCEEILAVDVVVDEQMVDLRGFSFTFGFDDAVLVPALVAPGELVETAGESYFFQWLNPEPGATTIEIDAGILGGAIAGPGVIVHLEFTGVGSGESALTEIAGTLRDGNNEDIPYQFVEAVVNYLCATVLFEPPAGAFDCGETITIDVVVDEDVVGLASLVLALTYDPAIVRPLSVQRGQLLDEAACGGFFNWVDPAPESGVIQVEGGLVGCTVDGPGSIVRIVFGGEADGVSPLDCLDGGELRTTENDPIPFLCVPAEVYYLCPIGSERAGWGDVKYRFR